MYVRPSPIDLTPALLGSPLLYVFFSIRGDRLLREQLDQSLLFRLFVGSNFTVGGRAERWRPSAP